MEIPIDTRSQDSLVITAGKLLGIVTAIVALTLGATTFIYATIIDSKLDRMELRMVERFAQRSDAVSKREYDLRHQELIEQDARLQEKAIALELRVRDLEAKAAQLEAKSARR